MNRPRKTDKHLPPCVHHRHGAFYYVKKGKWHPLGKELTEALIEYSRLISTPKSGMADLIERAYKAMAERKTRRLAKNTLDQYRIAADRLKNDLAEFEPSQVKSKHVAQVKNKYASTPNMANRVISFLRLVFDYAVEWQEVESNPCIGIKRYHEEKRTRYLTDAEYKAIHAKANPRMQVIMGLCYHTGQRITDVLNIRLNDITAEGIAFTQQKTGKRLTVGWTADLRKVVEAAKAIPKPKHVEPMTLLFTYKGLAPNYFAVRDDWRRTCERAGVTDTGLHDLRAKAGTDAQRQGLDPTALLGHTDKKQTDTYIRDREIPVVLGPSFGQQLTSIGQK